MSTVLRPSFDAAAIALPNGAVERPLTGFRTLFYKESLRFWKVGYQTVGAPILTAVLYLLIFSHVLESHVKVYGHVSYTAFLIPGLVMMSMLQNAFANSSSSLIQSKISGNLVFVLLTPLTHREVFAAYVLAAMVRGLVVGCGVFVVDAVVRGARLRGRRCGSSCSRCSATCDARHARPDRRHLGREVRPGRGVPELPDHAATFLSGVFYSVHSLPPFWQAVSHANPFFYMIDGFRYGFFGVSDVSPWTSLAIVARSRPRSSRPPRCACSRAATRRGIDRDPRAGRPRSTRLIGRTRPIMMTKETIRELIATHVDCTDIDVRGDDGAHFEATIVAPAFEGKSRVARHQLVYARARRPHARGDPRAVDQDADAGRVVDAAKGSRG